jgi:Formate hydrogenlyase subunit 3/Multisubunit Na+/H+ antiporter, MnhD subunit
MYSDIFLLATAVSGALAVAALRLGLPAALASVAAMLLFLIPGRGVLGVLPYVGEVAVAVDFYKLPFLAVSVALGLIVAFYSPPYLWHLGAPRWYYGVHALYVLSFLYIILFENLIFVFLALELSIITSFLLIWYFGYGNRRFVALLYFIWAQVGSILFLIGVAISGTFNADVFTAGGLVSLLVLLGLLIKDGDGGGALLASVRPRRGPDASFGSSVAGARGSNGLLDLAAEGGGRLASGGFVYLRLGHGCVWLFVGVSGDRFQEGAGG